MTVSERIKARRKELGLSADKVAEAIGKDRSTIFRYERGDIDKMPIDILNPIAKALGTTPAYLMGWQEVMEDKRIDDGHRELVALIEQLTDEEVAELSNFVDYIISKRK